jgi:hypothetical protein
MSFGSIRASFAEGEDTVVGEPVTNAEVVLTVFNTDGVLEPIGEPVVLNPDGSFDIDLPAGFPDDVPVFAVVQSTDGTGVQQISCVSPNQDALVDPMSTAIANTFLSFANEANENFNPYDTDNVQIEQFVTTMQNAFADVPLAEDAGSTVQRFADAMGLKPEAFLDATAPFNINPEDKIKVAALIDQAAAPENFNVIGQQPPPLGDIPPGSHIPGLIPKDFIDKFTPKGFDFSATFGSGLIPPGGLIGDIPPGAFIMPPGLKANDKVPFPDKPVFPQGIEIPKGFPMPPQAILPPGIILGEGFVPPPGLPIPPGVIAPPNFDPTKFGAVQLNQFQPPAGFVPPPGFGVTSNAGGFGMPEGFALPRGVALPDTAVKFPPPTGFAPPPPPKGFESANLPPIPPGFQFPPGAALPPTFNPTSFGFVPPPNFQPKEFGGANADFGQFKGDNFTAFDPLGGFKPGQNFGGFFGPPLDANGNPIPGPIGGGAPLPPPPEGFDPSTGITKARVVIDATTAEGKQIGVNSGTASTVIMAAPEGTTLSGKVTKKLTASRGVYTTGKVKYSASSVRIPVVVDPSLDVGSVTITLNVSNSVESTDLDVVPNAIQLVAQLSGGKIELSTANSGVDSISNSKVTGYLLKPGSSARNMLAAIKVTGTVSTGESGDIVSFKKPTGLADGVYTLTFDDGESTYYGKVTIGTVETRSIKGKVLAPGGSL